MKHYWHTKNNNAHLIVIFNGWGFDQQILSSLMTQQADVLLLYDYTTITQEILPPLFENYVKLDLLAWSFGVFAANECAAVMPKLTHCIAVNGTLTPVHDQYGIPRAIFYATLQNYSEESKRRFAMRIAGSRTAYNAMQAQLPLRSVEEQLAELSSMEKRFHLPSENRLSWTKAILSKNDGIFPFSNMLSAWEKFDHVLIEPIQASHYIDFNRLVDNFISC